MRFQLVDRISEVQPGKLIRAYKNLTLAEEYLADHFPGFPVMPGVLMLQSLVEAGAWLLRATEDFAQSMVVLREARNVKYGTFMEPGRRLCLTVELTERLGDSAVFKGKGEVDGNTAVAARFAVASYNLGDHNPGRIALDREMVARLRNRYSLLRGEPGIVAPA